MIAKYFLNDNEWFEEEYIFGRKWSDGQTFILDYIEYTVIKSEIVNDIYYVHCSVFNTDMHIEDES